MNSCRKLFGIFLVPLLALFFIQLYCMMAFAEGEGADGVKGGLNGAQVATTAADLLEKAVASQKENDKQVTADLYYRVHEKFPETPEAEKALWQSAQITKEQALDGKNDWERVRDLHREYISYYPGGEHVAQAYLEMGIALNAMGYQREALTYFKLCVKQFPKDDIASETKLRLAKVLVDIGHVEEAADIFQELVERGDDKVKLRAILGKADILNSKNEYKESLAIYHDLAAKDPNFFRNAQEALRIFGEANLFAGNVERGQEQLIHYLNLAGESLNRSDVLFEVGESYLRQHKSQAAQKMFKRAIVEGDETRRSVIFSTMRLALYLDDPSSPPGKWDKPHKLTDPEGDVPYLTVLDLFYNDPLAQEARLGLFWRFKARKDIKNMLDYGNNYLRLARVNVGGEAKQKAGLVFLALAEDLLAAKHYQDLYDVYQSEYEYVNDYPNGRLLYLVGQATDALALYDQAAVIYYRALRWPLSDEDKIDLYYKRARVYLLKADYMSAERLLTHLRKIYKGDKAVGEVYFLSGQLREAQKKEKEALDFYQQAADVLTFPEKRSEYSANVVRLNLLVNGSDSLDDIEKYIKDGALSGDYLQKTYLSVGDMLRLQGANEKAIELYSAALAQELPQDAKVVQAIHISFGDALLAMQEKEVALEHFQKALLGDDIILKQMAQERLNQHDIDNALSKLRKVESN